MQQQEHHHHQHHQYQQNKNAKKQAQNKPPANLLTCMNSHINTSNCVESSMPDSYTILKNKNEMHTLIEKLNNEYYADKTKVSFLGKNAQKRDVAMNLCENMDIVEMMKHTIWIIPNTNRVYFDYHMFKMFAHPNNYINIVNEVMRLCRECIDKYNSFSVHINLLGFTISASERYKGVIELFCGQCLTNNDNYSDYLEYINVYNTPNFIENITRIMGALIPPQVKSKVLKLGKPESEKALPILFSGGHPRNF